MDNFLLNQSILLNWAWILPRSAGYEAFIGNKQSHTHQHTYTITSGSTWYISYDKMAVLWILTALVERLGRWEWKVHLFSFSVCVSSVNKSDNMHIQFYATALHTFENVILCTHFCLLYACLYVNISSWLKGR